MLVEPGDSCTSQTDIQLVCAMPKIAQLQVNHLTTLNSYNHAGDPL